MREKLAFGRTVRLSGRLVCAHQPGGLAQDCGALCWTNTFDVNEPGGDIELRKISK